jgi:hypothetical protein
VTTRLAHEVDSSALSQQLYAGSGFTKAGALEETKMASLHPVIFESPHSFKECALAIRRNIGREKFLERLIFDAGEDRKEKSHKKKVEAVFHYLNCELGGQRKMGEVRNKNVSRVVCLDYTLLVITGKALLVQQNH